MGWRGSALVVGFAAFVACGETSRNPPHTTPASAGKPAAGGSDQFEPGVAGEAPASGGAGFEQGGFPAAAAGAPAGGEGGAPPIDCSGLWVPGDYDTLSQAIATAPDGGT